jgi:hypothetical protein
MGFLCQTDCAQLREKGGGEAKSKTSSGSFGGSPHRHNLGLATLSPTSSGFVGISGNPSSSRRWTVTPFNPATH